MSTFLDVMGAHLQRNHDLHEQAKTKAARLDDGSTRGRLKAALILALDDLRVKKDLVALWRVPERADGTRSDFTVEQEALALVDLREARDKALEICRQLEALGVRVKLSRREGYLDEGEEPRP